MQFHPNELFLLYNPETNKGKQTKAIAKTINSHIHEVNAVREKLGPTYWKEVVNMLGLEPKQLLDRSNPEYQAKVAGNKYTMNGWLDVIMHNPHLLSGPIAIFNGKAVLCNTPTDIFKISAGSNVSEHERVLPHLKRPL